MSGARAVRRRVAPHHIPTVLLVVVYLLLGLTGVTTSSLGADSMRADPSRPASGLVGQVQVIRTDEYAVSTPIQLSIMATGDQPSMGPLSAPADLSNRYANGPVGVVVYWDQLILRLGSILPADVSFAFHWWLPYFMVLLLTPVWFVQLGHTRAAGWLAGGLIVLAPHNAWWSMQPAEAMQFGLAGSVAMLAAHRHWMRGQHRLAWALTAVAGVMLAGVPTRYFPWAIIVGCALLFVSVLRILSSHSPLKARLGVIAATGAVAAVLCLGIVWEGRQGLTAMLNTTYPGARRAGAAALSPGFLLDAPFLRQLGQRTVTDANASELSTGWNIAFIVWFMLLALLPWGRRTLRRYLPEIGLAAYCAPWLVWVTTSLGEVGPAIPFMSQVTPERAAQIVGLLGTLGLCMALGRIQPTLRPGAAVVTGAVSGLATASAGALLKTEHLPDLSVRGIWLTAILVGLAVAAMVAFGQRLAVVLVVLCMAATVTWQAGPIQRGLGDLRHSEAAELLFEAGRTARAQDQLWASNYAPFDFLMIANGVPTMTGYQRTGPVRSEWEKLDPSGANEDLWNRGAGFVNFIWDPAITTPIITSNGYDTTVVQLSPCYLKEQFPQLSHIASTYPVEADCLTEQENIAWAERTMTVYEVS